MDGLSVRLHGTKPLLSFLLMLLGLACRAQAQIPIHADWVREDVVGVVLHPDGVTPVSDLPVHVWDSGENKVIFKTKTDENGQFRVPYMNVGESFMYIGRVRVHLNIVDKEAGILSQQHTIVVVTARHMNYGPLPLLELLILPELIQPPPSPPRVSP
jgi:hypothetical protein